MLLTLLCLSAVMGTAGDARASDAGATSIRFEASVLADLGIEVLAHAPAFDVAADSDLAFALEDGDFEGFSGGALRHTGALVLRVGGSELVLTGFELRPAANPLELDLYDAAGARWLRLEHPQPRVAPGELYLDNVDVTLAPELAQLLGRDALAGAFLGEAQLRIAVPAGPGPIVLQGLAPCDEVFTADRDVALIALGLISQVAREPGGRVAITYAAQLRNVGTSTIEWGRSIEPDGLPADVFEHPFLALRVYRILNGRIEQVGRSDVKHAFFSTNTGCPCFGAQYIYEGCEDTYGAGTNANQLYLAPPEEVTASTGQWTRVGSHFDGVPADDFRNHTGAVDHDAFEHRLLVDDADLQTGGTYFTEAWYLIRDDVELFNSMGHIPFVPTLVGPTWTFQLTAPMENGSVLDEFVDPLSPPPGAANVRVDTGEGRLQLAVQTTDLGGGLFHYEYALMNFDFDRQIRSFRVPLSQSVAVSNASFADADGTAVNDWSIATTPQAITWTAPAGNELDWATLYSFGFDADAAPVDTSTVLGVLEAGGFPDLPVAALGPVAVMPVPAHGGPVWLATAALLLLVLAVRKARYA